MIKSRNYPLIAYMKKKEGISNRNKKEKAKRSSDVVWDRKVYSFKRPLDSDSSVELVETSPGSKKAEKTEFSKEPKLLLRRISNKWNSIPTAVQAAIVTVAGTFLVAIISETRPTTVTIEQSSASLFEDEPVFSIINPAVHPDSSIYVIVTNNVEANSKWLDVELDGLMALKAATLVDTGDSSKWVFTPSSVTAFPRETLTKGQHEIRIGIPGKALGDNSIIFFVESHGVSAESLNE